MKILRFDLRSALDEYEAKTGLKLSYNDLSSMTSISVNTIKSLATRENYNSTFQLVSEIANALDINPVEYLEWYEENGK